MLFGFSRVELSVVKIAKSRSAIICRTPIDTFYTVFRIKISDVIKHVIAHKL